MSSELKKSDQKVLPKDGERNVLITSALPYVNNVPHLGNIVGAVLSADVYARYCRQRGVNTLYICGTDEYGTATETKALAEGVTPEEICEKYHKVHKEVYEWFDISFDLFGRTSTPHQTKIAQDIFMKLNKNEYLTESTQEQLFDEKYGKFLADRFVTGTCPLCGYEDARGDQCDRCGKLLNPMDLINPVSALSKEPPVLKETTHMYLKLPELQDAVKQWYEKSQKGGNWSSIAEQITNAWLKEGLKERCITRDLKWGTPVPMEKFSDKVFYVWFDAPIGYISITANYTDDWEKWWKNPKNVDYVQFMGKDNVPFHSVIFPASLIGTKEEWTMVNSLSSTEYLNYESGKFSKSRNVGVFGDQAKSTGVPSEVWRYYLLTNRPEQSDTVFDWDDFSTKINNELLSNLGNFTNRVLKFISNSFDGFIPEFKDLQLNDNDLETEKKINELLKEYNDSLEKIKLKEGLHIAMGISRVGNVYLQDNKPWELAKKDPERCKVVLFVGIQILRLLITVLEPYMPGFSSKVFNQLGFKPELNTIPDTFSIKQIRDIKPGDKIGSPEPIFKKLLKAEIDEFRAKFGGAKDEGMIIDLDLRAGKILEVEDHPQAEKLYKMVVQVGDEEKRQIVGGLKESYPDKEKLKNKSVVVVCNLKHSKLRGVKSEGMLLVGKTKEGEIGLLQAGDGNVKVGTQIVPLKGKTQPFKILNKKLLTPALKPLKIGKDSCAEFDNRALTTSEDSALRVKSDNQNVKEGSNIC